MTSDWTVYTWGRSPSDGVSRGELSELVGELSDVVHFETNGLGAFFVLKSDQTLWAWGNNDAGLLGDGTTTSRAAPMRVAGIERIAAVIADRNAVYALDEDGVAWHWGTGVHDGVGPTDFQKANGFGRKAEEMRETAPVLTPVPVPGLSGVRSIWAAMVNSFKERYAAGIYAIQSDGTVWEWGGYYQIKLHQISGLASIKSVTATKFVSFALGSDGRVWAWGGGEDEPTGDGTAESYDSAVQVRGLTDITALASEGVRTFALDSGGQVWAWGRNHGQLGIGTNSYCELSPVRLPGLTNIVSITADAGSAFAVDARGAVYSWGKNDQGQLGDGTTINRSLPERVYGLPAATQVVMSAFPLGGFDGLMPRMGRTAYARCRDGSVWAWGNNSFAQLGIGSHIQQCEVPQRLKELPLARSLSVLGSSAFAVVSPQRRPSPVAAERADSPAKEGCYVATCVYGSYDCPEVQVLRLWRDAVLRTSPYGRAFVRIYYATSPALVRRVGGRAWFARAARPVLDALVARLRSTNFESCEMDQ